jgi:subtilisin family serine protease
MVEKLDPRLREQLELATAEPGPGATVDVIVHFTGESADLAAVGFAARSPAGPSPGGIKLETGPIAAARLGDLAAIDHVVWVSAPKVMRPELDYSVPETRAELLRTGTPSRQGTNVVIGIIDTGIDWRHRDFVGFDDRTSRIVAIWDQLLTKQPGETDGPGRLGVQYSQADISRALQGLSTIRSGDLGTKPTGDAKTASHGTHVAGIAAGDGSFPSLCHAANTYVGMAPLADIIVVRSDFTDDKVAEGLRFIFGHKAAEDKAVVVNLSFGSNIGPHDGTDAIEQEINRLVAEKPGRAVVVSAGNEGDSQCHFRGTVGGGIGLDVRFEIHQPVPVLEEDVTPFTAFADVWYDRAGALDLTVTAPSGQTSGRVPHGAGPQSFVANPGDSAARRSTVKVWSTVNGPFNRDNNFRVEAKRPQQGHVPGGTWTLRLDNPGVQPVDFHCWLAPTGPPGSPRMLFPNGSSRDSTLTSPAMAAGAIAVANYASRSGCCDCFPTGDLDPMSSWGPLVHDPADNQKPEIAAPGVDITAARADQCNLPGNCCDCCPNACCCLYWDKSGTSMAAPHVTGAIALMFQENPHLTKEDVVWHLRHSARASPAGGNRNGWGSGKLDALAAVESVRAGRPAGGGGGGGGPVVPHFYAVATPLRTHLPHGFVALREAMVGLPDGDRMAAAASRHFSEIRRLINTNRRVATMWHRANGPGLLRQLLSANGHGCGCGHPAPTVTGERERRYLGRFFEMLDRYGSARLRVSLDRYRTVLIGLMYGTDAVLAGHG